MVNKLRSLAAACYLITGCIVTCAFPALAQEKEVTIASRKPLFEVASVRVTPKDSRELMTRRSENGRLTIRRQTLKMLILWAYEVPEPTLSVLDWMNDSDQPRFDIDAKADGPAPTAQVRLMLQALLAERFGLATHRAVKDGVRTVLRVSKNGSKLNESEAGGKAPPGTVKSDRLHLRDVFSAATIPELVYFLQVSGSAALIDQTGLTGRYDFVLDYGRFIDASGEIGQTQIAAARIDALHALGLETVDARVGVDTLFIDQARKSPSGN